MRQLHNYSTLGTPYLYQHRIKRWSVGLELFSKREFLICARCSRMCSGLLRRPCALMQMHVHVHSTRASAIMRTWLNPTS